MAELNAALNLDLYHLLDWGSNPQPVGITVPLRAAAPRLAQINNLILQHNSLLLYLFI